MTRFESTRHSVNIFLSVPTVNDYCNSSTAVHFNYTLEIMLALFTETLDLQLGQNGGDVTHKRYSIRSIVETSHSGNCEIGCKSRIYKVYKILPLQIQISCNLLY